LGGPAASPRSSRQEGRLSSSVSLAEKDLVTRLTRGRCWSIERTVILLRLP
jgi:hypothetical protein